MDSSQLLGSVAVAVKADLSQLVADFSRGRAQTQAFASDMQRAVGPTQNMTRAQQDLSQQVAGLVRQYDPLRAAQQQFAQDSNLLQRATKSGAVSSAESAAIQVAMAKAWEDTTKKIEGQTEGVAGWARHIEHNIRAVRLIMTAFIGEYVLKLAEFAVKTLEATAALKGQADALGVTTAQLQEYNYVAGQSGLTTEEMQKALGTLKNSIDDAALGRVSTFSKLMQKLGVDIKDSGGKVRSTDAIFKDIIDRLGQVGNKAQQQGAAVIAFGEAGQKMGELIKGGSAGINDLQEAAKKLGLVLSDDQIAKADETAKKLDTLEQVLKVKFAATVVDNAQAIEKLATALENFASVGMSRVVKEIGAVIQRFNDLANAISQIMGLLDRLSSSGDTAAANAQAKGVIQRIAEVSYDPHTGAISGTDAYGDYYTTKAPASSTKGLNQVAGGLGGRAAPSNTISLSEATDTTPKKPKGPNIDLKGLLSPKDKKGKQPKFDTFEQDMAKELQQQEQIEHDSTTDITEQNRLEKLIIDQKFKEHTQQIARQVKNGELTKEEAKQLTSAAQTTVTMEKEAADHKLRLAMIDEQAQFADEMAKLQDDALTIAKALARTDEQRKTIDAKILDSKQQQAVQNLQTELLKAKENKDGQRVAELEEELVKLHQNQLAEWQQFNLDHLNAMQKFTNDLPRTTGEFNDAIKKVAFDQFNKKLDEASQFASDVGDAFGNLAGDLAQFKNPLTAFKSFISNLAATFTKNFIEKPVSDYVTAHLGVPLAKQAFGGQLDKLAKQAGGTALTTNQMNTALGTATQSLYVLSRAAEAAAGSVGAKGASSSAGGMFSAISGMFGPGGVGTAASAGGLDFGSMFGDLGTFSAGDLGSLAGGTLGDFPLAFGFASGGYTGSGSDSEPKGIVHANEFVIHADAVRKIGLPFLHSLNGGVANRSQPDNSRLPGYAVGGFVGIEPDLPSPMFQSGLATAPTQAIPTNVTVNGAPAAGAGSMNDAAAMLMQAAQMLMQFAQGGSGKGGGGLLGGLLGVGLGMIGGGLLGGKGGGGGGLGGLLSGLLFPKSKIFSSPLSSLMGGMGGGGGEFTASSLGGLTSGTLGSVPLNFGFDKGGFTGSGADHEIAGVVHKNEWVWDAGITSKYMPILQMIGSGRIPSFQGPGLGQTVGRGANANQPLHVSVGDVHLHGVSDERTARQTANQFLGHVQQRTARVVKKGLNK